MTLEKLSVQNKRHLGGLNPSERETFTALHRTETLALEMLSEEHRGSAVR